MYVHQIDQPVALCHGEIGYKVAFFIEAAAIF